MSKSDEPKYTTRQIRFALRYAAWLIHGKTDAIYTENGKKAMVDYLVVSGTGKISTVNELGKNAVRYMTDEQLYRFTRKKESRQERNADGDKS